MMPNSLSKKLLKLFGVSSGVCFLLGIASAILPAIPFFVANLLFQLSIGLVLAFIGTLAAS